MVAIPQPNHKTKKQQLTDMSRKPITLAVQEHQIPESLKKYKWCVWRWEKNVKGDRWAKIPRSPISFERASTNKPHTFGSYAWAVKRSRRADVDGIGVLLTDDLCGIDLDDGCHDREQIAKDLDTYAERSPTGGTGLKAFARGRCPGVQHQGNECEIYDGRSPRWFAVTGHRFGDATELAECQDRIDRFYAAKIATAAPAPKPESPKIDRPAQVQVTDASDAEIMDVIRGDDHYGQRFDDLFAGRWEDRFESQSSADAAMVALLGRYGDHEMIDRIFRSSALYREKWDRDSYREMTIEKFGTPEYRFDWLAHKLAVEAEKLGVGPVVDVVPATAASSNGRRRGKSLTEIEAMADPTWIIQHHLGKKNVALLVGPPGAGKSFVALEMGLCIATGRDYIGCHPVAQGKVAYVYSEGEAGVKLRWGAWKKHHKIPTCPDDLKIYPYRYDLLQIDEATDIANNISVDFGGSVDLIIVDTLARNFIGDENSPVSMSAFLASIDHLRATGASILIVHHTGKDASKGARGHSSLRAAADTVIMVDTTDGDRGVMLSCDKLKDGEPFKSYTLGKTKIPLGTNADGDPLSSLVLTLEDRWQTAYRLLKAGEKDLLDAIYAEHKQHSFEAKDVGGLGTSVPTVYRQLGAFVKKGILDKSKTGYVITSEIAMIIAGMA